MDPTQVKGKSEPIHVYKLVSILDQHAISIGLRGVQAELIGREAEMGLLLKSVESLKRGQGSIISIIGDAGTGKSRLTRELKNKIKPGEVQWIEGHAYPYTQNIAYYPLINLLTYAFQIKEGDKPNQIKNKIELGVKELLWDKPEVMKYLGGLFSVQYDEIDEMSPEFWQKQLHLSVQKLFEAFASRGPTVFLFEDLHWADKSFLNLIHLLTKNTPHPVLFLCVYRPIFHLFEEGQPIHLKWPYQEILLHDLSWDHTQSMLQSLLGAKLLPDELRYFIKNKAEGNPFYLEEVVNSLLETGILKSDNGSWKLTQTLNIDDVPPTIQGVLTARLDRLERETKRILQEASVIGRAFFYEVLKRVTALTTDVDKCLSGLESLDLIRMRNRKPDLEYIFKHALTQEVAYSGLLKKDRQEIHEKIGCVIEKLFQNHLSEVYETLSFHFKNGHSTDKAIYYLIKSGQKNFKKYAVEESNRYYQEAFDLLANKPNKSQDQIEMLIDLIFDWAIVHYFRGDFRSMRTLLENWVSTAETLNDKHRLGMYYAWYGFSMVMDVNTKESYDYLMKALDIGEKINNQKVIGYSCAWLPFVCVTIGKLEEAIRHARRALEIAKEIKSDLYLYYKPVAGIAFAGQFVGNYEECFELGNLVIDMGKKQSNPRSIAVGYVSLGTANIVSGNYSLAISDFRKAIEVAGDPFYKHWAKIFLAQTLLLDEQYKEAEAHLSEIYSLSLKLGWEKSFGWLSQLSNDIIEISKGNIHQGIESLKDATQKAINLGLKPWAAMFNHIIGKVYLQIILGNEPINLRLITKNFGFLVMNLPFASKKAEYHLNRAVDISKEIGAYVILGQAYLDLALLQKKRKRLNDSSKYINEAIAIFNKCKAETHLEQAKAFKMTIVSIIK
jgi:predicted ATPase